MAVCTALPRVLRRPWSAWLLPVSLAAMACGTDAVGVDACRQVEEARCRQAPACRVSLEPPVHTTGSDVDECIRLYDVACLHGLQTGDPGPIAVSACVTAIQMDGCSVVVTPQSDPKCAWLVPPTTPVDAGSTATDAADADDGSDTAAEDAD